MIGERCGGPGATKPNEIRQDGGIPTYPRGARVSDHAGDALAQEREALRATVRTMLERTSSEAEVRRHMETETGYDEAVWKQAAEGLGLTGLAIPEEYGGSGVGPLELAGVFGEGGPALYGGPPFSPGGGG